MKPASLAALLLSTVMAAAAFPALTAETSAQPPADVPAAEKKADAAPAGNVPAQAEPEKAAAAPAKEYTVIKLGNEEIKSPEIEEVWKSLFPGGGAPDFNNFDETIRQNVLRGLVSEKLVHQEALKEGFDKSEEVKKRLQTLEKQVVMQSFVENKSKNLVTEQQLRTAYAEKAAALKDQEEVRAKHILVATEPEAKELAKQLKKKPADFDKIAKEKSTDKGTAVNGGDLGYFTKERMVPEFADAAFKLKKGDVSDPVKSQFGWHVLKIEDRRKIEVPTFEAMKESLQVELTNKALQDYIEGLLAKADIKYYGPDGKEKEFSRSMKKGE